MSHFIINFHNIHIKISTLNTSYFNLQNSANYQCHDHHTFTKVVSLSCHIYTHSSRVFHFPSYLHTFTRSVSLSLISTHIQQGCLTFPYIYTHSTRVSHLPLISIHIQQGCLTFPYIYTHSTRVSLSLISTHIHQGCLTFPSYLHTFTKGVSLSPHIYTHSPIKGVLLPSYIH